MGLNHVNMWLFKRWIYALKVCDEDIVLFFYIVDNLYKLPRPMLFPTTSMISVSTNKIKKKYTLFFYFKSKANPWFRFPQTKIKIYFFLLQIKSKSMILVSTNKNKNIHFSLQIKTKSQANLIKLLSFLRKSIILLVSLKWNLPMLLRSWLGRV